MHTHRNAFIFLIGKVFVNPKFGDQSLMILVYYFLDVTGYCARARELGTGLARPRQSLLVVCHQHKG